MAKYGYFRLEHSAVNRATKGDGYLAASANYAANSNKCERVLHVNMSTNRYAIRDIISDYEAEIPRKNARLGDKILLSLPKELSEAHRYQAARRFLWAITGEGRSRAVAFYHADHAHNPHMHVILLDRDVETGDAVAMMGASRTNRLKAGLEPNATEWLRKTWEAECNAVLKENGYGIVMDRRTNLDRGLDNPGEHRGFDNDNAKELAPDNDNPAPEPLAPAPDSATLPELAEDASKGDTEPMATETLIRDGRALILDGIELVEAQLDDWNAKLETARAAGDTDGERAAKQAIFNITHPVDDLVYDDVPDEYRAPGESVAEDAEEPWLADDGTPLNKLTSEERLKGGLSLHRQSLYFATLLENRDLALQRYDVAKGKAAAKRDEAHGSSEKAKLHKQLLDKAQEQWNETHREDGRAKGFKLAFFGYTLFESKTARLAGQTDVDLRTREFAYDYARKDAEELENLSTRQTKEAEELHESAQVLTQKIEHEGGDDEVMGARDDLARQAHRYLYGIETAEMLLMIEEGEITVDEAMEALRIMGREADREALAEQEGIGGQSY